MSKDITEYIDDWCLDHYGHTNWEFINKDNINKYIEINTNLGIGVLK